MLCVAAGIVLTDLTDGVVVAGDAAAGLCAAGSPFIVVMYTWHLQQ
jgi:hypothetical protein